MNVDYCSIFSSEHVKQLLSPLVSQCLAPRSSSYRKCMVTVPLGVCTSSWQLMRKKAPKP